MSSIGGLRAVQKEKNLTKMLGVSILSSFDIGIGMEQALPLFSDIGRGSSQSPEEFNFIISHEFFQFFKCACDVFAVLVLWSH